MKSITTLLHQLRTNPPAHIAGRPVKRIDDLAAPQDGLPPTDGLRIWLDEDIRVIIRPSGTEAKLKCYIEVISESADIAEKLLDDVRNPLKEFLS
jgi:phosphomannomutase